jgi:hypothetical protein
MALRFTYKLLATRRAVVPLGGRWVRPRALIPITIIGPGGTFVGSAQIDTGSDDTVFSDRIAVKVGIDLTNAPVGEAAAVAMGPVPLRYARVTLRLASGQERREWEAWVGFTSAPLNRPLLGFAGFLQFFTATFFGDREEVELAVNSSYQGQ